MENNLAILSKSERLRAELAALFRAYGYERYRMAKFESYEVYLKNKDYIDGGSIVTFNDSEGRLKALKPDVTLSIINNLPSDFGQKKYYYDENVFRRDRSGNYREIHQIGMEYIGGEGSYPQCEAVILALTALKKIGGQSVLSIGHTDAVKAFSDKLGLDGETREQAYGFISAKAFFDLKKLLDDCGAERTAADALIRFVTLEGEAQKTLAEAKSIAAGPAENAVCELENLIAALDGLGLTDGVKLDFSLTGDNRYYNGILFRGYVSGAAGAVISGGRYDSMLKGMGIKSGAVGFALDFESAVGVDEKPIYDVKIIAGGASDAVAAASAAKYVGLGFKTVVLKRDDPKITAAQTVILKGDAL